MTDDELIRLLEETPPEDLTAEQVDLLRARLPESSALRAALADHVRLEQTFHTGLGRVNLSAESILRRAEQVPKSRSISRAAWVGLAAMLLIAVGLGLWLAPRGHDPGPIAEPPGGVEPAEPSTAPNGPSQTPPKPPPAMPSATVEPPPERSPSESPPAVVVKTAVPEPWDATLKLPPQSLEAASLTDLIRGEGLSGVDHLDRWWETIEGAQQPGGWLRAMGHIYSKGLYRLRAPLPTGHALRLGYVSRNSTRFHFFRGRTGVTFDYAERNSAMWTAYRVERPAGELLPQTFEYHGSDGDRYRRVPNGMIEFRHERGRLWLLHGDLPLLSLPMPEPPDEVLLEPDKILITGADLIPVVPMPELEVPTAEPPASIRPSELTWKTELPAKAQFALDEDGSVVLSNTDTGAAAIATTLFEAPALTLWEIDLADFTSGSGFFLGDRAGKPLAALGFYLDKRQGTYVLTMSQPYERRDTIDVVRDREPIAYASQRQRLRLLIGLRTFRVWATADGLEWNEALFPRNMAWGSAGSLGLFCTPATTPRSIRLRRLESRTFPGLQGSIPEALHDRIPDLASLREPGQWHAAVVASRPDDWPLNAWRTMCATHHLQQGTLPELEAMVLAGCLRTIERNDLSPEQRLNYLRDLTSVYAPHVVLTTRQLFRAFEELSEMLLRQGGERPQSTVRRALWRSGLMGVQNDLDVYLQNALRGEVLDLVHGDDWEGLYVLVRRLRYFTLDVPEARRPAPADRLRRLLDWGQALALRNRPQAGGVRGGVIPPAWRHPLVEQLGKEGYNVLAELDSALAGGAFKDACQVISSVTSEQAIGLLPNAHDPELLVSLPGAVALAMRDHPTLQQVMQGEFGSLAELRLRQAIVNDDAAAIQALTTQFFGTLAASEAAVWIGDHAWSTGDSRRAEAQYRAALPGLTPPLAAQVRARLRLLAATVGRDEGEPPKDRVKLQELDLSAAEFERLVSNARQRPAESTGLDWRRAAPGSALPESLPTPARWEIVRGDRFEGELGRDVTSILRPDLDWYGIQLGWTIHEGRLIVSNRFQTMAFDLSTGRRAWNAPLDGDPGRTHSWPLVVTQPMVAGGKLLLRRMLNNGPEIACLDVATGKLIWRTPRGDSIASDPLLLSGRISAVTASPVQQDVMQWSLTSFDPQSGLRLSQTPIVQCRDVTNREALCQAVVVGDTILVVGAGSIIGCDLEGNPRWLRRQTWFWPVADAKPLPIRFDPPVIDDGHALVVQPGVPTAVCVEIQTGRLLWQHVLPDPTRNLRLLGTAAGLVFVQSGESLQALDRQTGALRWTYISAGTLNGAVLARNGDVLLAVRETIPGKPARPNWVWIDGASGEPRATAPLAAPHVPVAEQITVEPLILHEGQLWGMMAHGASASPAFRELVRFATPSQTLPLTQPSLVTPPWVTNVPPLDELSQVWMGPWTLFSSAWDNGGKPGYFAQLNGRVEVFQTLSTPALAAVWGREVVVPASGDCRLVVELYIPDNLPLSLKIRVGNDQLWNEAVDGKALNGGLGKVEVGLDKYAGRKIWVFVEQHSDSPNRRIALWKRLEVISSP